MADPAGGAAAAKKPRVKKGYPRGIIDHPTGVYQARIQKINDAAKRVNENRPIPGLFKTIEDAVTAQAAAQLKFDNGEEVWPAPKFNEPRNARGQVCAVPCARSHLVSLPWCFCPSRLPLMMRLDLGGRDRRSRRGGPTARRSGTAARRSRSSARASAAAVRGRRTRSSWRPCRCRPSERPSATIVCATFSPSPTHPARRTPRTCYLPSASRRSRQSQFRRASRHRDIFVSPSSWRGEWPHGERRTVIGVQLQERRERHGVRRAARPASARRAARRGVARRAAGRAVALRSPRCTCASAWSAAASVLPSPGSSAALIADACYAGGTRPLILKIRSGRLPRFRVCVFGSHYVCVCVGCIV